MLICASVPTGFSVFLTTQRSSEVGVLFTLTCTVTLSHRARDSSLSLSSGRDHLLMNKKLFTECQIVVVLSLRSLILIHSHWLVEETTHVQLYTQWWDIVLPRVTLNQSFQSVSYPPLVPVYNIV